MTAQPPNQLFPTPAPQRSHRKRNTIIGVIVGLALLGCVGGTIGAVASGNDKTSTVRYNGATTAPVTITPTTATATPTKPSTAVTATKPPAPPKPATLLTFKGSGIKNSAKFSTGNDWTIHWSYNCASFFGGKGNFIVDVYDGGDYNGTSVNELGKSGHDTAPVYDDAGSHYLSVNSECPWHITVTQP